MVTAVLSPSEKPLAVYIITKEEPHCKGESRLHAYLFGLEDLV